MITVYSYTLSNIVFFVCVCVCFLFELPAVKRLMKEAAELRDPTEHYHAQPLEVRVIVAA